jgi:hypothetical protein
VQRQLALKLWLRGHSGTLAQASVLHFEALTRREFRALLDRDGGFRIHVRLLVAGEGGRRTPILGKSAYQANWSIERDPNRYGPLGSRRTGASTLIDARVLRPGEEAEATLIPLFPKEWWDVVPGSSLAAFEGDRQVARAVVTDVIAP